ncbi:hypothetical protein [Pseudoxanthomonas composti]|uniref:Uncharacterized protein n=1 Tax=Pseudoxanthomonas composti TaxID=2137479 RepID=A0A4Q1JW86_9GAMM|nr:hypothetical protein [Pseudoxanthomonas composti]RXR06562.1 hypothetical protein EPA99_07940 [Pseudoxanthomonas composti]
MMKHLVALVLLLPPTLCSAQTSAAKLKSTTTTTDEQGIEYVDQVIELAGVPKPVSVRLLALANGNTLYRPEHQSKATLQAHAEYCRSRNAEVPKGLEMRLGKEALFTFPCVRDGANSTLRSARDFDPKTRGVAAGTAASDCFVAAQMTADWVTGVGEPAVYEGEGLFEKGSTAGAEQGTLAVQAGGFCSTAAQISVEGWTGTTRQLFIPLGCRIYQPGAYVSVATATMCGTWHQDTAAFNIVQ